MKEWIEDAFLIEAAVYDCLKEAATSDGALGSEGGFSDGAFIEGGFSDGAFTEGSFSDGALNDADAALADTIFSEGALTEPYFTLSAG